MATDTDFHQTKCDSWSRPEIPSEYQNPQAVSVSEMLDHGSISFGRFAAESLEWEKWSVFSHNRCKEELEKFKAPGFVAQKKAYFEEYYKRLRAMKASQATQQQETAAPSLYHDVTSHITQVENSSTIAKKFSYLGKIQTLENDASTNSDSPLEGIVEKQEAATNEVLSNWTNNNERSSIILASRESLYAAEPDQSTKEDYSLQTFVTRNSEISHHETPVSNSVKHIANKPITQGNVASARNRTKIGARSTKDGIKSSEKTKPSPHDKITAKRESRTVLGKSGTPIGAKSNNSFHVSSRRQHSEACSGSTVLHTSLPRSRLPSSSTSLPRNGLVSSSPSSKTGQREENSNRRYLADEFPRSLPGYIQSGQCSQTQKVSGSLEQKGTDERKIIARLKNLPVRNKLNQNCDVEFAPRSCDKERKQKAVEDKSKVTVGRGPKSAITTPTSRHKNSKLVQKNTKSKPTNPTRAQNETKTQDTKLAVTTTRHAVVSYHRLAYV